MKEKLIVLLKEGHKHYYDGSYKGLNVYEPIADHLIANGVTVQKKDELYGLGNMYMCGVCHEQGYVSTDFCPNCGADMRGEEHESD